MRVYFILLVINNNFKTVMSNTFDFREVINTAIMLNSDYICKIEKHVVTFKNILLGEYCVTEHAWAMKMWLDNIFIGTNTKSQL